MKKNIIVTGASSGIGLAITKKFIGEGWTVHGIARNRAKLKDMGIELGENFYGYAVDVSNSKSLEKVFSNIKQIAPSIQVLVNNAAIFKSKPFLEFTFDEMLEIIKINLLGSLYCTHFSINLMKNNYSRIINISSVSGLHGIKNQAVYSASKFGLNGFAESLAQELTSKNIFITTICPGGVNTPLWDPVSNPYLGGEITSALKPEQVADAVMYVSKLSKNIILKEFILFPSNEWH